MINAQKIINNSDEASSSSTSLLSTSAVSSGALVINSTHRPSDATERKTLDNFGISNKEMQKTFLSLRNPKRIIRIGLSCVELTDVPAYKSKCNDIKGSILAMNAREPIHVIFPVQLMMRHGLPHLPKDNIIPEIQKRLRDFASVFNLDERALYPLIQGKAVEITKEGTTLLSFHPWTEEEGYLPKSLEQRIDKMVLTIAQIFINSFSRFLACSFLTPANKTLNTLLINTLKASISEAPLDADVKARLNDHLLTNMIDGVLFQTLLTIAHRYPSLAHYVDQLSPTNKDKDANKNIDIAEIGTKMLQALQSEGNRDVNSLAHEFAHGVAYIMEEISSPKILEELASENDVMIYIAEKEKIRRTNAMRIMGSTLKHSNSPANLETCNAYETVNERENHRIAAASLKQTSKPPSPQKEEAFLAAFSKVAGKLAAEGHELDHSAVDTVYKSVFQGFYSNANNPATQNRSESNSNPKSSSDTDLGYASSSSKSNSRGSSPSSEGEGSKPKKK